MLRFSRSATKTTLARRSLSQSRPRFSAQAPKQYGKSSPISTALTVVTLGSGAFWLNKIRTAHDEFHHHSLEETVKDYEKLQNLISGTETAVMLSQEPESQEEDQNETVVSEEPIAEESTQSEESSTKVLESESVSIENVAENTERKIEDEPVEQPSENTESTENKSSSENQPENLTVPVSTIEEHVEEVVEKVEQIAEEVKDVVAHVETAIEESKEVISEVTDKVEEIVASVTDKVEDIVENVSEAVEEAEKIVQETKEVVSLVEETVVEAAETVVEKVVEAVVAPSEKSEQPVETKPEVLAAEAPAEKSEEPVQPVISEPEQPKITVDPNQLPEEVPYLIIGGGAAAFSAMRSITSKDPGAKVLILTEEEYAPYQRPPLSKELWFNDTEKASESLTFKSWNNKDRSIYMDDTWHFAAPGELLHYPGTKVGLATDAKVSHLDADNSTAVLADGRRVKYNKCLVAIGGKPKQLPELDRNLDADQVTYFRKLSDFKKLEKQSREQFSGKTIAVVGGGFLGSELAVALGKQADRHDFKVNQIIKEKGNLGYILPDYLSKWTTEKVKKCNVNVVPNERITGASKLKNGKIQLKLISGKKMIVDHVVAAVGLEIDEKFAENSDLEWDSKLNGFMVNSELQARSNVWVAGDATSFYDIRLGRRKVEHHDHAIVSGRLAGANMAAIDKPQTPYWHQSMFWSDLGPEVGFEAIGLVDSKKLRTVGFFAKATNLDTPEQREKAKEYATSAIEERGQVPIVESKDYGKGVIFYLNNKGTVVGMISWNLFGKMKVARKIIADKIQANDEETLKDLARLFKIDP